MRKALLKKFWEQAAYRDAQGPLESWYEEAIKFTWPSPQAVKSQYKNASICNNNRIVFNIGGNKCQKVCPASLPACLYP
ncbi:MAG: type II toxin-antitoxin system HigB family toxin [Gammaproteobacteria bacterium]